MRSNRRSHRGEPLELLHLRNVVTFSMESVSPRRGRAGSSVTLTGVGVFAVTG